MQLATLIGDVVGSRRSVDRRALHRELSAALRAVAGGADDPPSITVGDEFQGSYPHVGDALAAAWTLRLALAPDIDVRFGIGWGTVNVLDAHTGVQDGPGWWAARAAIEWTAESQRQPGLALVRITYRNDADTGPPVEAVNAALMCRDHMFGSLDERSIRILRGLMAGRTKKQLAADEQISPSAVSQRAGRDGLDLMALVSQSLSQIT